MAHLPERLFKYVSSERIDILENLSIRFTQPSNFNDPFETRLSVDGHTSKKLDDAQEIVNRKMYRRLVLSGRKIPYDEFRNIQNAHNKPAMEKLKNDSQYRKEKAIARAFEKWDSTIGILSLSASEKNLLMWAHYADSHRGMLIEFHPKHSFFNAPNPSDGEFNFGMLTKVIYSQNRPKDNVETTSSLEILPMIKTKSDEWVKEQEWRIYQLLENRDKQISAGNEAVNLFKLPPDCIKRVVVGYNMSYQHRRRIIATIKANSKLKDVKIEESVLHLDLFSLEYKRLPPLY